MSELSRDWDLLRAYVDDRSEDAFSQLVGRHLDMVYATSLRQVHNPHLAEEVTQAVFIILARKAQKLNEGTVLAAWLYKAARYAAMNALKMEKRRRIHEQRAAQMTTEYRQVDSSWCRLEPLLDEGLATLGERDRSAIVLRFLQQRSFREVGSALGISEGAAEMRVSRALAKLRDFFGRRSTALPSAALANILWLNASSAAPSRLRQLVSQTAFQAGSNAAAGITAHTLAETAMRAMGWAKVRLGVLLGAGAIAALVGVFLLLDALLSRPQTSARPQSVEVRVEAPTAQPYR
ncbi:MAG TPA: sigma-70 family RNA polymerase sigma factor [Tepidisphaeraceae bacterium]|nr:sigma-70 family RNA polymerase sigma factor [Tepidisphaeraceae bacterium]